ncbi:MAG: hypothetical protein JXB29_03360 [Sedimentisphaerales bacterium]|nr:hypothetical protein [Sedimentisphaerales bacterium]
MNYELKNSGFSLIEVLLAVGTLAVGMLFVAGVFPVALHFSTLATERSIAAAVADEAFAKIRLYAIGDPNKAINDEIIQLGELKEDQLLPDDSIIFADILPAMKEVIPDEFAYPSTNTDFKTKQYLWSALFRLTERDPNSPVQVTVFVSRKTNPHLKYRNPEKPEAPSIGLDWPVPVKVKVSQQVGIEDNELKIENSGYKTFINDGCTIVDDKTGRLYRVLKRYADKDDMILLDRDWVGAGPEHIWVVPPAIGSGRNPCIAIYQKVIRLP